MIDKHARHPAARRMSKYAFSPICDEFTRQRDCVWARASGYTLVQYRRSQAIAERFSSGFPHLNTTGPRLIRAWPESQSWPANLHFRSL
jgi:hypothetical protein